MYVSHIQIKYLFTSQSLNYERCCCLMRQNKRNKKQKLKNFCYCFVMRQMEKHKIFVELALCQFSNSYYLLEA